MLAYSPKPTLCATVTEALGKVPIVRLNRLHPSCQKHHLYLKLESCNPGGSIKEKNAIYLVREAENRVYCETVGQLLNLVLVILVLD